jgi:predicted DsbA family dithiol-disulfide isomerase
MAPHWFDVGQTAAMPIDPSLWHDDPPDSSYPACLAVKAAGLQGGRVGRAYLRLLREAAFLRKQNVARAETLLAVADQLAADPAGPLFDALRFRGDLTGEAARDAFASDLREVKERSISRFPTVVIRRVGGPGLILTGYRPHDVLVEAMARAATDVRPVRSEIGPVEFVRLDGRAIAAEVAAALGIEYEAARAALDAAAHTGEIARDDTIAGAYRAPSPGPAKGQSQGEEPG